LTKSRSTYSLSAQKHKKLFKLVTPCEKIVLFFKE
jgi:hypothetical protein